MSYSPSLPPGLAGRLNPVCDRFENQWLAGAEPRLEEFLPLVDESDRRALLRELLALELEYRGRPGEQPSLEEYRRRLPEYTDVIAAAFAGPPTIAAGTREPDLSMLGPAREAGALGSLDHYEVLEVVGRGGMGVVFKARDTKLQRIVAIKILAAHMAADDTSCKRFVREAQAAAAIRDAHVVGIHAVHDASAVPYLVMEFIGGVTLAEQIQAMGPPTLTEILRIGMQTAAGLAAAHRQGLIHRDVKPANILLENGVQRIKITDFGLARAGDNATLTQSGMIAGTPAFMSPEQARADPLDHRSDLFSLGSVLYFVCTGTPPFAAANMMAVLKRVVEDVPRAIRSINSEIPDWLAAIVDKLLAKDPKDRFESAAEVAQLLEQHLAHLQQSGTMPALAAASVPGRGKRRWSGFVAAGILAATGVALAGYFAANELFNRPDDAPLAQEKDSRSTLPPVNPPDTKQPPTKGKDGEPTLPAFDEQERAKKLQADWAKKRQADWAAKLQLPVETTNKIGMKLMLIPPTAEAFSQAYYLGKFEVTQWEWEQVMSYNPSGFGPKKKSLADMDTSVFPVERVNWFESVEFCNRLSELEHLKPYYELTVTKRSGMTIEEADVKILGGAGYHIPTGVEWEHGCRAGTRTIYHCGDNDEDLLEYAWFDKNSDGRTHAVGGKKPNAFGLYDMHGNVREWTEEILTNDTTGAPERVARGGYWNGSCAVNSRYRNGPAIRSSSLGLRVAKVSLSEAKLAEKKTQKLQADWAAKLQLPVEATNKIGMKLMLIPPAGEALPQAYYLGKYEVTQGEWMQVMNYNPSKFGPKNAKTAGLDTSKFPVESVNWFDSVAFCNNLSQLDGLPPYYELKVTKFDGPSIGEAEVKILGGTGYHLPTDAEWDHGCRAGTQTKYHCGDRDEDLVEYAWFKDNSEGRTRAVGEKKPNAFGLFDMHGNVREWNEEMLTNVTTGAPERVNRGGNWKTPAGNCAVSSRYSLGAAHRTYSVGLRVARAP